ncbi:TfoX/Sxy family protein [Pseudomonas gingeri]|uniref:TfoX/Sxy family protein n=1 Tax=Pseudomonas gingeri TaxID=117681 RepID=A0A7Y8BQ66_9PSED|nr:TfoX/Sxy family protein [Pseudomonas gingeri]NWB83357.1 TfoX/Sxy family protein [Pseudomonas gingeri]
MASDPGLEELMRDQLSIVEGLSEKAMFGGLAWLMNGHLLCAARNDGALIRLGKDYDREVLAISGITPMISRGRIMEGWLRVESETFADDLLAQKLLAEAVAFVRTLPRKK